MGRPISRRAAMLILVGLFVAALGLRLWGITYGLPNVLCRPDEEKIVAPAAIALREGHWRFGTLIYPGLLPHLDWSVMYLADGLGRLTGRFDAAEGSFSEWPQFHYTLARLVSALLGAATVLVGYRASRELGLTRFPALFASLVVGCNYLHVRDSHFATADVAATFFVTLSLQLSLRALRVDGWRGLFPAALAAGLATSTKYQAGMVLLAPAVVALTRSLSKGGLRRLPGDLGLVALGAAVAFAASSPLHVLDLDRMIAEILDGTRAVVGGRGELGLVLHSRVTLPEGLGLPTLGLAALGLVPLARRRPAALAVTLAFAIPWAITIAQTRWVLPRYVTPLVPVFALLAAAGLDWVARSTALRLVLVAGLLTGSLGRSIAFNSVAARDDTRLLVAAWASRDLPRGARVLVCEGYGRPEIRGRRSRGVDCSTADIRWGRADVILLPSHPHLDGWLRVSAALRETVRARGRLLARFDPFEAGRAGDAWFYGGDAFFIPMTGLDAVERGGPVFEAWALPREGGAFEPEPWTGQER